MDQEPSVLGFFAWLPWYGWVVLIAFVLAAVGLFFSSMSETAELFGRK